MTRRNVQSTNAANRQFLRLACVLHALWKEGEAHGGDWWCDTRLFDMLVSDENTVCGTSRSLSESNDGKRYREHVVPRLALCERSMEMYKFGKDVEDVAAMLRKFLRIVYVTRAEATRLDARHKSTMPIAEWWTDEDAAFARLRDAQIDFELSNP